LPKAARDGETLIRFLKGPISGAHERLQFRSNEATASKAASGANGMHMRKAAILFLVVSSLLLYSCAGFRLATGKVH
jgi:hypothetical protein